MNPRLEMEPADWGNPDNVIANELNQDRFVELRTRGFQQLTQEDALSFQPMPSGCGHL